MTLLQEQYQELLSLTQLYLFREHSLKDLQMTSPPTYHFFQKNARLSVLPKVAEKPFLISAPFQATTTPPSTQPAPDPQIPEPQRPPAMPEPRPDPIPAPAPPDPFPPTTTPEQPSPDPMPPMISQRELKSKSLHLEPLKAPAASVDPTLMPLMRATFLQVHWIEHIPDDRLARKKRDAWAVAQEISPVVILSFDSNPEHLAFLKNVAHAISLRLAPAQILTAAEFEKSNQWDSLLSAPQLRLVIASDHGIYLQPGLKPHYREVSQQGKHFLQNIPLLMLSDISLYLKQPQLKSLLWRAICNEFALVQPLSKRL
jgi:hypothetical protein